MFIGYVPRKTLRNIRGFGPQFVEEHKLAVFLSPVVHAPLCSSRYVPRLVEEHKLRSSAINICFLVFR
jgi:hypothetical protein